MYRAILINIVLPIALLLATFVFLALDDRQPPRVLNPRQAAAVQSLQTARPSDKDLK